MDNRNVKRITVIRRGAACCRSEGKETKTLMNKKGNVVMKIINRFHLTLGLLAFGWLIAGGVSAGPFVLDDWTDAMVDTYFQAGHTITNTTTYLEVSTPLATSRQLTVGTDWTWSPHAAGFVKQASAAATPFISGTCSIDAVSHARHVQNTANRTYVTLGIYSSNLDPATTIRLNSASRIGVIQVMNRHTGNVTGANKDAFMVEWRDATGSTQTITQVGGTYPTGHDESGAYTYTASPLTFPLNTPTSAKPYTIKLIVHASSFQALVEAGGENVFDSGEQTLLSGGDRYLGLDLQLYRGNGATLIVDNLNVAPDPQGTVITIQ